MDKKIFFLAAVAVLFVGALIWLAFFLQLGEIREMSDNIQKEQLDSLVRQERSQKILEMGKELGDVEKNKNDMSAMLVDKNNAVPFLKMLENIAAATENEIKISVTDLSKMKSQAVKKPVVQESDPQSTKDLQKEDQTQKADQAKNSASDFSNQLGFSIELTGGYGSLVDFFTKLENLPYFARVYNFQIAPVVARQTVQSAGSGAAPASSAGNQPAAGVEGENKNIKSTITIGVYTNATK